MEKEEAKINQNALERRATKKPSGKNNKIRHLIKYCKGCGLCVQICPTGTLQLIETPANKWGVTVEVNAPEYCIGCKMCENQCPDFAIFANYEEQNLEVRNG